MAASGEAGPMLAAPQNHGMEVELLAHFAGCNRTPGSADWASTLAYAAGSSIVLCDPENPARSPVEHLLVGHTDRVNCVKWFSLPDGRGLVDTALVSGSTDNNVRVWRLQDSARGVSGVLKGRGVARAEWTPEAVLKGHTGAVTCVDALCGNEGPTVVCSGSADGTLKVWATGAGVPSQPPGGVEVPGYTLLQTESFNSGFALAVALSTLPKDPETAVLAVGGDDCVVRIYTFREADPAVADALPGFVRVATLAGHQDWVRTLAFATFDSGELMLASGAQDMYIRLWQIEVSKGAKGDGDAPVSVFRRKALEEFDSDFAAGPSATKYSVRLDSLLMGHDNWVYSVRWHPRIGESQPPVLLSASMDRTLMLWTPDVSSGVWIDAARMGEAGGTYTNGLFGGLFSPTGRTTLAHGFHGAFYMWACGTPSPPEGGGDASEAAADVASAVQVGKRWTPQVAMTGHFQELRDLAWDATGNALFTASDDQTVRIYSPCPRHGASQASSVRWHEIARPQIHGYDLRCLAIVGLLTFATGADEKIVRVFEAPLAYVDAVKTLTPCRIDKETDGGASSGPRPVGASIPALGLSNKAVFPEDLSKQLVSGANDSTTFNEGVVLPFEQVELKAPPLETHLVQNTLWPETRKLYGHGFEVVSLSVSHSGDVLLSTCKATTPEHAVIRVWSTQNWQQVDALEGHKLTVTRTAFSPSDEWVVSGSRDRQICVFCRQDGGKYLLHQTIPKAHDRIIWDLAWAPSDGPVFVTGSRDKMVKFWSLTSDDAGRAQFALTTKLGKLAESVTALDWVFSKRANANLLAVGFDNGRLEVFSSQSVPDVRWLPFHTFPAHLCHTSTVRRLRWRPASDGEVADDIASSSADGSARVFRLHCK